MFVFAPFSVQDDAVRCLKAMAKRLKTLDEVHKGLVLMEMKRIGEKYKHILVKFKNDIAAERESTTLGLSDTVALVIDFLEDRT